MKRPEEVKLEFTRKWVRKVQHADARQAVECARRVREEILKRLPCQAGETGIRK